MEDDHMPTDPPGPSSAGPTENGHGKHKKHKRHALPAALENAPVVDFDEVIERRQKINDYSRQFGDNVQKLQRGIDADITIDDVVSNIEEIDASQLVSGKDMAVDGVMIHKAAQILAAKSGELRGENAARLDVNLFALRVKEFATKLDPTVDPFTAIGNKFGYLLRRAPPFDFMRPSLPVQQGSQFQVKKERERAMQQRNKDSVLELQGRTAKQAIEGEPDSSLMKYLDNIRRCLRNALKQRNAVSMGYYEFVLHPENFNESVENMFHLSFLIKDGYVRLTVDQESGMPVIELVPKHERQQYQQNDRSTIDTAQDVTRLDMYIWKTLVEQLNIRQPLITKPTE